MGGWDKSNTPWRRISQSEILKIAAEKKSGESEGGQKFLPPNPLPFCPPERSVLVLPREARQSIGILFKMSSDFFQQTPPIKKYHCRWCFYWWTRGELNPCPEGGKNDHRRA